MSLQVWLPLNKDPNMTSAIASYNKESGVTLTEDVDGWYKVQDTTHGANNRWGIYYNFNVKPNTTYTLYVYSKSTTGVSARVGIQSFAGAYAWPAVRDTNAGAEKLTTYTWTTGATHNVARVYLALTTTATKANDYVFYKEPKVYEHPRSQGILNNEILNTNWSLNDNGKLGKCIKTGNALIDLNYDGANINTESMSIGGWFKFNKNEIAEKLQTATINETRRAPIGNLIGNNSYNGIGIIWETNNMYQDGELNSIHVFGNMRTASLGYKSTGAYTILFDTWIHILLVYDYNLNTTILYINGLKFSEININSFSDAASRNIAINANYVCGGNGPGMNIPFYCNDVRLYNHALTGQEVKKIAQGLIVHYPLNNNGLGNENLVSGTDFNNTSKKYTVTSGTEGGFTFTPTESIIANTNYIVSCRLRGNANINLYKLCTGGNEAINWVNRNQLSTTEYKSFSITFTYPSSKTLNQIYICTRYGSANTQVGDWFEIEPYSLKLEKGNIATSWCPNVSDVLYTKMGINNNIVYDISGFNNNGTVTGALSTSSDTVRYKVSTYFSGSSYISREPLHSEVKSFSFWLKCANASTTQQIVFIDYGTKLAFGFYNGYIITSYTATAITGNKVLIGDSWIDDDWNHIVVIKNNNAISTYCNGTLMTASGNDYWSYNTDEYFMIGRRPHGDRQLLGYISDFRAYATALSATDIAELYEMGREVV